MNTPRAPAAPRLPAFVAGLLFACAIVLASLLLDALARALLRAHLVDTATRSLAALVRGDTPAQWNPARAADVVTGAAFDAASSRVDADGLHARSAGRALEVGLVLASPLDLGRLAILDVTLDADAAGTLAVSLRRTLDGPLCTSSSVPVASGAHTLRIDLDALTWPCSDAGAARPTQAGMLRLRLDLPADAGVRVSDVRLRPPHAFPIDALAVTGIDPPFDADLGLDRVPQSRWPVVEIGLGARVETILLGIDRIRAAAPAAIVVPRDALASTLAVARAEASAAGPGTHDGTLRAWCLVGALAAALAWIRLRPWRSTRVQAGAELAAVAGVPLVLIVGGAIGDDVAAPTFVAFGLCVAFAASLLAGRAPRQPATRTWRLGAAVALASLAVAALIVALLRDPAHAWSLPTGTRALRYLGWAALQQVLVTVIVAGCIERLTGSPRVALLLAAFVFALLHAPNAMLMQFTFLGGLIWTWNWQRHRAVLANTFAHATSGLLLTSGLPPEWLRSAEIGTRYFLFGNL